jgi:hypothetical protein
MFGETSTRPIAASVPTTRPATTPPVLQRFQYSVSSTTGRLADAATANASATRCATFWPLARIPIRIATTPTISEQMRAAFNSSSDVALSPLITPTQMSCDIADAAASTRPATTATMVANATAATNASIRLPRIESFPPPRYCASSGAAMFPPRSISVIAGAPTFIAAPRPRKRVST